MALRIIGFVVGQCVLKQVDYYFIQRRLIKNVTTFIYIIPQNSIYCFQKVYFILSQYS